MKRFFYKNKKRKKINSARPEKIRDVITPPEGNYKISFKERVWKVEISRRIVGEFFYRHKPRLLYIISIFIFIFGIFGYYWATKADTIVFYPNSCLGGWRNSENAKGEPDINEGALIEEFNENNSAVLENAISQIFCGDFGGEAIPDSEIKKVSLKLSLALKIGNAEQSDNFSIPPFETTSTPEIINATTSEETNIPSINPFIKPEERTSSTAEVPELNSESEQIPLQQSVEPPAIENQTAPAIENPVPENPAPENPAPVDAPASGQQSNNFFWDKIIRVVFAEEVTPESQEIITSIQNEPSAISAPILDNSVSSTELLPIEEITTSSQDEIASGTEIISPVITPEVQNPFLEVFFTLDGENWQSLGKIGQENWEGLILEIPVNSWENVSKIQIKIESLSPVESLPVVYLDGMRLEVEYKEINSTQEGSMGVLSTVFDDGDQTVDIINSSSSNTDLSSSDDGDSGAISLSSGDKVEKVEKNQKIELKIFDGEAEHSCSISLLSQEIRKNESAIYQISLKSSSADKFYETVLGGLPTDTRGVFGAAAKEQELIKVPLIITAGQNPQTGSFNITVVYREVQNGGEVLANFCQLNLIINSE